MAENTPQQMADRVREGLFANDRASKAMGMQVLDVTPGQATVSMTVRPDMLNGHDTCHGGIIATLADSAFADFNAKYFYDAARPITIIRDGVVGTADPTWTPLLKTPPHPSYVSGHSTYSAAAATVCALSTAATHTTHHLAATFVEGSKLKAASLDL